VSLSLLNEYQFLATFSDLADPTPLVLDDAPPLGGATGPSATGLLAAAAAHCAAGSLLSCLRTSRARVKRLTVNATAHIASDDVGRRRITCLNVEIVPDIAAADLRRLEQCEENYAEFCTVAQSLRRGIPVNVTVNPRLHDTENATVGGRVVNDTTGGDRPSDALKP
jgi:uncharacterized OsmC-like protein